MAVDYNNVFKTLLEPIRASGSTISVDHLFSDPLLGKVAKATKLKHLKKFISGEPSYVGIVEGVLPNDAALIAAIEQRLGSKIDESNVVQANFHCMQIVQAAAKPVVESYVSESLSQFLVGGKVSLPVSELIDFLLDDYATFARGAGNGLISTAGRMNEQLLIACLEAAGMIAGKHFTKTGTKSEADIVIHSSTGAKVNLGVEVKSHHARERLLRGLKDVTPPKVGAGYFVDPTEFGEARTMAFMQANTAAVYLPLGTLSKLDQTIRDMRTYEKVAAQSRFYRPLERFATDMSHFSRAGLLPKF